MSLGVLLALALSTGLARTVYADAPYPHYGTRVVDGDTSDWNLAVDVFANMYRAGNVTKPLESKAYLRYDCNTNTLFVLVLAEPGVVGYHNDPEGSDVTSWIAIDTQSNKVVNEQAENDGGAPDFMWVGEGFDGDLSHMLGYETSFTIIPGNYNIITHMQVLDELGQQTSATLGFPGTGPDLILSCAVPVDNSTWGRVKTLYR